MPRRALALLPLLLVPWLPARAVTSEDRAQFGDGLFSRGLYDLALKEYLPLTTNQPPPATLDVVLFRAAECLRQTGHPDDAASLYGRVVKEFPKSAYLYRAAFRRAELFATGGKYIEAVNYFRALVDMKPPADIQASALYWQGYCEAKMNLLDEAVKSHRRVVAEFADSPFLGFSAIALADLLQRRQGDPAEIRALYERAARAPASPRAGAEAWFQLGDLAYRGGDYAGAVKAYEQLLKRYPSDERAPQARLQAAWSFHRTGRHADALKLCEEAAAGTAEQRPEWRYLQANCERQLGRMQAARESYAALLREAPAHPLAEAATYEQALVAFEQKDYAAVLALGAAADRHASAEDFLWMVAESQSALGKKADALETYKKLGDRFAQGARALPARFQQARLVQMQGDPAAAAAMFREVGAQAGTNALAGDAYFQAAMCNTQQKKLEEALKDWSALLARFPAHAEIDRALYEKAQAEVALGRDADGRATVEQLLKAFPDRPASGPAHFLLGVLLERAGQFEPSEFHYQSALKMKGTEQLASQIQFRRASVLQRQGRNEDAAALLQGLLGTAALTNMQPQLLEWLARFNLQAGKAPEAEAAALALVKASADPSWQQMGWYIAGRGRQAAGRSAEAREAYEAALKLPARTREGVEAALYLGRVALETKDFAGADTYFSRAAEMASGDDVLDIRAQSYFGLGQAARAQEKWEDASRYFLGVGVLFDDPKLTPEALYGAAEALGKLNRPADREKTLQELKQRYPDSEWSRK